MKRVATATLLSTQNLAAAGSVLADAGLIRTASIGHVFVTGADATKGVRLPPAVAGKCYIIKNDDAANAVLKVYPYNAGTQINAITAGTEIAMAAKTSAIFVAVSATHWTTTPLLPS